MTNTARLATLEPFSRKGPHTMSETEPIFGASVKRSVHGIFQSFLRILLRFNIPHCWLVLKTQLFTAVQQPVRGLDEFLRGRVKALRKERDLLKTEEEKTEALLLNILPPTIAAELRATGSVEPLTCDDVTVCFTDFVGFTLASEKLSACELVATLHKYFTAFDEIITAYGLEKLKTIGDSYMFVSGLPKPNPSHAVAAVLAALEIVEAVKSLANTTPGWSVRVGVHSGPVVAGVVGTRKFSFDIWGETVNLASRHESSGQPNLVNISERTYELVRHSIPCEPRGLVPTKEGRHLEMYFASASSTSSFGNRYRSYAV